jgi:hypothetical protein
MRFKQGDLVLITHSYEYPELEGSVGMIMGMTELEFDDEDKNELVDVFDVHCGDEILQCYSDDLEVVKNEKCASHA